MNSKICPACGTEHSRMTGARLAAYCASCHARHMRENRPKHSELTVEQRRKANARAYANVYQRRGKLTPQTCPCGQPAQKHHPDYGQPLAVQWLCRQCHHALHLGSHAAAPARTGVIA